MKLFAYGTLILAALLAGSAAETANLRGSEVRAYMYIQVAWWCGGKGGWLCSLVGVGLERRRLLV